MTGTVSAEIPVSADSRPRHVAIIMDGNHRWAKARRLKGVAGHKAGVDAVRAVVETCAREGVEVLTLFAFSSENWRRPKDEVSALMKLFLFALEREVRKLHRNDIRLRIIGDRSAFSASLREHMAAAEELTRNNSRMTLVIAANYGGHWDITQATRKVAEQVRSGQLAPSDITDDLIQQHLSIGDLPMPDLRFVPQASKESAISCFGTWLTQSFTFHRCIGLTSSRKRCSRPCRPMPADSVALARLMIR